jgi:hypothetical protein
VLAIGSDLFIIKTRTALNIWESSLVVDSGSLRDEAENRSAEISLEVRADNCQFNRFEQAVLIICIPEF